MIFCRQCGSQVHESADNCPNCGAQQQVDAKSQNVALVFAALLGGFGAHRFYLGKTASGIVYLVFCWTGIPALVALVECFIIAFTSPQNWARKYNHGILVPPVHLILKLLMLIFPFLFMSALLIGILIPQYRHYAEKRETERSESPALSGQVRPQENPGDAASAPLPINPAFD